MRFLPRRAAFHRYGHEPSRTTLILRHGGLFLLTLITTTLAGAEWIHQRLFFVNDAGSFRFTGWLSWREVLDGLWFSGGFLGILTVHEMGHFLMAKRHGIRTSWPYYLPFYFGIGPSIGTLGAVIRIKDKVYSRREFFDIGVAGPLAGFAVLLPLLVFALATLPHLLPAPPPRGLWMGHNLLIDLLERAFRVPAFAHPSLTREPLVLAGYLGAFFTALNMLPIGQLDGGHVLYGLLGFRRAAHLSLVAFVGLVGYAGLGLINPSDDLMYLAWATPLYLTYLFVLARPAVPRVGWAVGAAVLMLAVQITLKLLFPSLTGQPGWLLLALLLARGVGLFHPPAPLDEPLDLKRKIIGWLAIGLLVLCFAPTPFE